MDGDARDLDRRIAQIAADRESGASELLDQALAILRDARATGTVASVARRLCLAQPSMASLWNAGAAALSPPGDPDPFEQFARRVVQARRALPRFAVECLLQDVPREPLHLITISMSRSVLTVIEAVGQRHPVRVTCTESRPALEGRTLATYLAAAGVPVTLYGDGAIADALAGSAAVVLGADAVTAGWFLNKSGSRMLAAAASQQGLPVYVAATRDKFISAALGERLRIRSGSASEIWAAPPPSVEVRNPYFERTPLDNVSAVISDVGVLGVGMVPDVCEAVADPEGVRALLEALA